jgi:hypothetical protein
MVEMLKTPDLKRRGWTDALIKRFMPTSDGTQPNPNYPSAAHPVKLYKLARVEKIESSSEFADHKRKADLRKLSAKKGVETKSAKNAGIHRKLTN